MKTRTGFVSNSSSSSFIIPVNDKFKTVMDVAFHMIPKRERECDQADISRLKKQVELGMSPDHPVAFQSCNYDTYIVKRNNGFHIATCNNHDWDFDCHYSMGTDEEEHDILYEMPYNMKYYNASYGITGFRYGPPDRDGYRGHEWCKNCVTDLWVCDGGAPFCPKCGKRPDEVDPFEVWWKKQPVSMMGNTDHPDIEIEKATKSLIKTVAQQAYEAGTKHGIEEG